MEEKKIYTEEEIEQLAEKASQNAMEWAAAWALPNTPAAR